MLASTGERSSLRNASFCPDKPSVYHDSRSDELPCQRRDVPVMEQVVYQADQSGLVHGCSFLSRVPALPFLTHLQGLSGFVLCRFVVQDAFLIFAVNCTFGPSLHPHYRDFFATMASADFLPFVVTAEGVSSWLDGSFR